jgi:hypothetical protein
MSLVALTSGVALAGPPPAIGQDIALTDAQLSAVLARFKAGDRAGRATAFYEFIDLGTQPSDNHNWPVQLAVRRILDGRPAAADTVTLALVDLVDLEDATTARTGQGPGDGYAGDLIGAVAALRDKRALPALLRHIASGRIDDRGIAALGDTAVAPVVALTSDPDVTKRLAAVMTLGEMFQAQSLNTENLAKARDALTRASKDASALVRQAAANILKASSGAAFPSRG